MIFLVTKFTAGAWVVVYGTRADHLVNPDPCYPGAGPGQDSGKAGHRAHPPWWSCRWAQVSRLTEHAIAAALSISRHVIAVTVVSSQTGDSDARARELQEQWARWNPGPPLRVLSSEYASAAGPIVALVDQLRQQHREQVVVLIPVAAPDRLRYRTLHNHFDLVLTAALRDGPDIITARVPTPLRLDDGPAAAMRSFAGTDT